jgi:hypothetical protein
MGVGTRDEAEAEAEEVVEAVEQDGMLIATCAGAGAEAEAETGAGTGVGDEGEVGIAREEEEDEDDDVLGRRGLGGAPGGGRGFREENPELFRGTVGVCSEATSSLIEGSGREVPENPEFPFP